MSRQTKQEEKLDMQIKKLLNNEIDTTNKDTKSLKKQSTVKVTKATKKTSKKAVGIAEKTKVINLNQIQKTKPMEKGKKLKEDYLNKLEKANEILDNETEVDKLIKFLTKLFVLLVSIMVIIFILICIV